MYLTTYIRRNYVTFSSALSSTGYEPVSRLLITDRLPSEADDEGMTSLSLEEGREKNYRAIYF